MPKYCERDNVKREWNDYKGKGMREFGVIFGCL